VAIRNIAKSRAKRTFVEVEGIKELSSILKELSESLGGGVRNSALTRDVYGVLKSSADRIERRAYSIGQSKSVPKRVLASLFTYTNPDKDKANRASALIGVNKKKTLVYWTPGRSKSTKAKKLIIPTAAGSGYGSQGGKVSESLASMFEKGTSKLKARTFFTAALRSVGQEALSDAVAGLKSVIERFKRV
jgi:hypothetical protein